MIKPYVVTNLCRAAAFAIGVSLTLGCTETGGTIGAAHDRDAGKHLDAEPVDAPSTEVTADSAFDDTALESAVGARKQLFNGRDLTGWATYLGPPYGANEPQGLNRDPNGVFSVVTIDDAPAIRISGEVWGALVTVEEFENYHLRAEFKWGSHALWPPLTLRDSGLLYQSVGPVGAVKEGGGKLADPPGTGYFMTSMELQIADGDVGSYYSLGPITVEGDGFSAPASGQYENPFGTWNVVELFVVGNESVHVVNGHPVVHTRGATVEADTGAPVVLSRGKIQLQSESAEIFFRALTLEHVTQVPADVLASR